MKLSLIFLLPEETHHKLMFVCPTCTGQTFLPTTTELGTLRCCHCGDSHDAESAEFEILTQSQERSQSLAGRHLRDYTLRLPREPGKP